RALEELADHGREQLRVAVLGEHFFHEELPAAQQRNGAQLRGGFDREEVQGRTDAGGDRIITDAWPSPIYILLLVYRVLRDALKVFYMNASGAKRAPRMGVASMSHQRSRNVA